MHVRIAWEIYNHQQKEKNAPASGSAVAGGDKDKLRAFPAPAPPPPAYRSPYELPPAPYHLPHHPHLGTLRRPAAAPGLDPALAASHRAVRVSGVSPFGRYGPGAYPAAGPFGLAAYGRELALSSSLHGVHHAPALGVGALHDAWRGARPAAPPAPDARRDHDERERARRERDERERRERDERERRKARDRELERARARSPLRNGAPEAPKDERKDAPRHAPPALPAYPPPSWDSYRFDPLQHMRFAPFVEAAIRAEEDRAKMMSAYAHHQQLKSGPLLHRGLAHGALAPLGAHAPLAPMASLAPPLAPPLAALGPLDLLKKEEPR